MKKLLKLRRWLSLPDAARHLSIAFGEEVSEADVLRLGLDGKLRLSVRFLHPVFGRRRGEASRAAMPLSSLPPARIGSSSTAFMGEVPLNNEWELGPTEAVSELQGVWDLPMEGDERLDVEDRHQALVGGQAVALRRQFGVCVRGRHIYSLQEWHESSEIETPAGVKHIPGRYLPARNLPAGSEIVVRTAALADLEKEVAPEPPDTQRVVPLSFVAEVLAGRVIPKDADERAIQRAVEASGRALPEISVSIVIGDEAANAPARPFVNNASLRYRAFRMLELEYSRQIERLAKAGAIPFQDPLDGTPTHTAVDPYVRVSDVIKAIEQDKQRAIAEAKKQRTAAEKPLTETERNSLLRILLALAHMGNVDLAARGGTKRITNAAELLGLEISDDTVGRHIRAALQLQSASRSND